MEALIKDQEANTIRDLFNILIKHIKKIFLIGITCILVTILFVSFRDQKFTATTTIAVDSIKNQTSYLGVKSDTLDISRELQFLTIPETIYSALKSLDFDGYSFVKIPGKSIDDVVFNSRFQSQLAQSIKYASVKNSNFITISFQHRDSNFAMDFVNALVKSYSESLINYSNRQLTSERLILEKKVWDIEKSLVDLGLNLEEIVRKTDFIEARNNKANYEKILSILQLQKKIVGESQEFSSFDELTSQLNISDPHLIELLNQYKADYSRYLYEDVSRLVTQVASEETVNKSLQIDGQRQPYDQEIKSYIERSHLGNIDISLLNDIKAIVLNGEESFYIDRLKLLVSQETEYQNLEEMNKLLVTQKRNLSNQLLMLDSLSQIEKQPVSIITETKLLNENGDVGKLETLIIGFILSAVIALIFVIIYEYFSDTIDDELVIIRTLRRNINPIITIRSTKQREKYKAKNLGIVESYNNLSEMSGMLISSSKNEGLNVHTICSLNSCTASSSLVVNIALSLNALGQSVLIFGMNDNETYKKIVNHDGSLVDDDKSIVRILQISEIDNYNIEISDFSITLLAIDYDEYDSTNTFISSEFFNRLSYIAEKFDVVLIDGPQFLCNPGFQYLAQKTKGLFLHIKSGEGSRASLKAFWKLKELNNLVLKGIIFEKSNR